MKSMVTLLMLCFLSVQYCGALEEGLLKGKITDSNGATIAGAAVQVESWHRQGNKLTAHRETGYTLEDGTFSFRLAPGNYDIFVSYPAFSPVARKIKIESGKETTFNPELKYDELTEFVY